MLQTSLLVMKSLNKAKIQIFYLLEGNLLYCY